MKKLFLSIVFILSFYSLSFAQVQEPEPIIVNENTATEQVVTGNEFSLGRLNIAIADDGSFDNSRITVVAMIGKRQEATDPKTGFKLFTKVSEQEIFSGTLAAYTSELDIAVANNAITSEQRDVIILGLKDIYKRAFDGYITTVNILQANGKLQLKAVKKAQ